MYCALPSGPDELQRWVLSVGARLRDARLAPQLPPLAAAAVDVPAARVPALLVQPSYPEQTEQIALRYRLGHASVLASHPITSPWCGRHAREIARRARWTGRWLASRRPMAEPERSQVRADFASIYGSLHDASAGHSVHEIADTHAIVEGLRWASGVVEPTSLYRLIAATHAGDAHRLRLLSSFGRMFGVERAAPLAARVCAIALKFPWPSLALSDLMQSLERNSDRIPGLLVVTPERFAQVCRLDPEVAALSTQELAGDSGLSPADAVEEAVLAAQRRYESLPSANERIGAALHPLGNPDEPVTAHAGPFAPSWVIDAQGGVAGRADEAPDLARLARWATAATELADAIAWLGDDELAMF
jgi:hypothetical protein